MDGKKVAAASKALKKYLQEKTESPERSQLFEDDGEFVYLVIKAKRVFAEHRTFKATLVELPTGVFAKRTEPPSVCVFVRDPQRDYKDALLEGKTPITRAVGVSKLKGKFKAYEARRVLRSDHDLFLAEDDVVSMLPKLLGKSFYGKQQYVPLALKLRNKSGIDAEKVKETVERILKSTPLIYPASQTMLVRIGTSHHSDKELAANAKAVMDKVGLEKAIEVSIRTNQSPTLPVYYTDKIYSESDIGEEDDPEFENEGQKRRREDEHLDELLAEVVDVEEIKNYNCEQKQRRKKGKTEKGAKEETVEN